jgi:hypothetical protein
MRLFGKECGIIKECRGYYLIEEPSGRPFTTDEVDLHSLAEQSGLACEYSRDGVFPWFPSEENLMKFIDFVNNSALEYWKSWYKEMTGKDI